LVIHNCIDFDNWSIFYYKPIKTKEVFKDSSDYVGSIVKDYMDSREQNLGKLSTPCETDEDCNSNIIECENLCTCSEGNCNKKL